MSKEKLLVLNGVDIYKNDEIECSNDPLFQAYVKIKIIDFIDAHSHPFVCESVDGTVQYKFGRLINDNIKKSFVKNMNKNTEESWEDLINLSVSELKEKRDSMLDRLNEIQREKFIIISNIMSLREIIKKEEQCVLKT